MLSVLSLLMSVFACNLQPQQLAMSVILMWVWKHMYLHHFFVLSACVYVSEWPCVWVNCSQSLRLNNFPPGVKRCCFSSSVRELSWWIRIQSQLKMRTNSKWCVWSIWFYMLAQNSVFISVSLSNYILFFPTKVQFTPSLHERFTLHFCQLASCVCTRAEVFWYSRQTAVQPDRSVFIFAAAGATGWKAS